MWFMKKRKNFASVPQMDGRHVTTRPRSGDTHPAFAVPSFTVTFDRSNAFRRPHAGTERYSEGEGAHFS